MSSFYSSVVQNFLIAFGVVIGASLFSGLGALMTNAPPLKVMTDVAGSIKLWAIAASFLGKEIKSLDADILVQVIDKRILRFDSTEYQLIVNKLVLSDILKLWVGVSLLEVTN